MQEEPREEKKYPFNVFFIYVLSHGFNVFPFSIA